MAPRNLSKKCANCTPQVAQYCKGENKSEKNESKEQAEKCEASQGDRGKQQAETFNEHEVKKEFEDVECSKKGIESQSENQPRT